eukprot:NODE_4510_length_345_cov_167.445946_g3907_i0.p3 GENE.NODE_4510_length_345_cov_167.445946_g3907_i0~~NODE_4510_length_345_cov_167.445946_g3907_i0.p3  ORF type:complete len:66 (+),score=30.86 NODE_4510_length_345_cov_167.445946_g3907_i0:32-199(+)
MGQRMQMRQQEAADGAGPGADPTTDSPARPQPLPPKAQTPCQQKKPALRGRLFFD